jgi:hypothetical protein
VRSLRFHACTTLLLGATTKLNLPGKLVLVRNNAGILLLDPIEHRKQHARGASLLDGSAAEAVVAIEKVGDDVIVNEESMRHVQCNDHWLFSMLLWWCESIVNLVCVCVRVCGD